jgi:hypothetical protein
MQFVLDRWQEVTMWKARVTTAILALALASACATTEQAATSTRLTGNPNGLLIVSLTITPSLGHPLHWDLHAESNPDSRLKRLVAYAGTSDEDWSRPPKSHVMGGRLIVQELPPGTYRLRSWEHTVMTDTRRFTTYRPKFLLPFRFRVEAGRAVYIGNLHLHAEWKAQKYPLRVFDARERDLALFRQRYAGIGAEQIDIRLLPGAGALPNFLRDDNGTREDYRELQDQLVQ